MAITSNLKPGYLREQVTEGIYKVYRFRPVLRNLSKIVWWQGAELKMFPRDAVDAAKRELERIIK